LKENNFLEKNLYFQKKGPNLAHLISNDIKKFIGQIRRPKVIWPSGFFFLSWSNNLFRRPG